MKTALAGLPLSPKHAVLMTWSDLPDDENVRLSGTQDHAANLDAFTVASADRQWVLSPRHLTAYRERVPKTAVA